MLSSLSEDEDDKKLLKSEMTEAGQMKERAGE
jgi:hypothetical protein